MRKPLIRRVRWARVLLVFSVMLSVALLGQVLLQARRERDAARDALAAARSERDALRVRLRNAEERLAVSVYLLKKITPQRTWIEDVEVSSVGVIPVQNPVIGILNASFSQADYEAMWKLTEGR